MFTTQPYSLLIDQGVLCLKLISLVPTQAMSAFGIHTSALEEPRVQK
jgi:hypothetical protein